MPERYRLGRLVKRGGMAEVFEATIRSIDGFERKVAIKRLLPDLAKDESLRATFIDEARILSRLTSANIVSIQDYGLMDDLPFQALEFIDGLDLAELSHILASRGGERFTPEIALHIATEVAHALEHAHAATDEQERPLGIVHRDVNPSNILVSWRGDVKLSDFGVALAEDRLARTQVGIAKGTISYMAPEQARGSGIDARTDIYALGLVLHWMISGENPLSDDDLRMSVHAGDRLPIHASIPEDIARIIERCTRFRTNDRYDRASGLAGDCWRALHRRITSDARQVIKDWIIALRPDRPSAQHPVADLFDLELFQAPSKDALPRYTSVARPTQVILNGPASGLGVASIPPRARGGDDSIEGEAPTTLAPAPAYGSGRRTPAILRTSSVDNEITRTPSVDATTPPNLSHGMSPGGDPNASPNAREHAITDPLVGTTVNGYRIVEQIGQGGWSRVYRAIHVTLGQERAIKIAREELSEVGVKRFRREAQILCKLQHPNIVRVVDCGTTSTNRAFLTMEILHGLSLKQLIDLEAPLDPNRAALIARQIAAGLSAAHRSGLVHRDLKPGNIMLVEEDGEERVRILDFGIARAFDGDALQTRLTDNGNFLGTPAYVSPEQIQSPSTVEPASDLYSLGIVMYRMLTGRLPFEGTAADMINAHLKTTPMPLPHHGELGRLVLQLLEKSPKRRPSSADEVVERINAALATRNNARRAHSPSTPSPSLSIAPMVRPMRSAPIRPDSVTPIVPVSSIAAPPVARSPWWPWALVTAAAVALALCLAILAFREFGVADQTSLVPLSQKVSDRDDPPLNPRPTRRESDRPSPVGHQVDHQVDHQRPPK
ncbi:MAG: serine/threonine protein kinase [Deltaproteobacteria bacterium]|nr:serine/threonine protein kinase [Deltaproteobacteria bacterium]